jgi:hypothetical protein
MQHPLSARLRLRADLYARGTRHRPCQTVLPCPGAAPRRRAPLHAAAPSGAARAAAPASPTAPTYERVECERVRTAAAVMQQLRGLPEQPGHCAAPASGAADLAPAAAAVRQLPCPPPPPAWQRLAGAVRLAGLEGLKSELLPERVVLPEEGRGGACRLAPRAPSGGKRRRHADMAASKS